MDKKEYGYNENGWITKSPLPAPTQDEQNEFWNDVNKCCGNTNKAMVDHLIHLGYRKIKVEND